MCHRFLTMLAMLPAVGLSADLTVALQTGIGLSASTVTVLRREVESLLSPSLIRVVWATSSGAPESERLAVVRFKGSCTTAPVIGGRAVPDAESLGKTYVVNGSVLPIAEIQCDSVRRFIAADLGRTRSEERNEILGRALGRIVSHELYHILLRTTEHGREGIARPAQSSSELVTERLAFAHADQIRLKSVPEDASAETTFPDSGR